MVSLEARCVFRNEFFPLLAAASFCSMPVVPYPPRKDASRQLREMSLYHASMALMHKIRSLCAQRNLIWLACVPVALFGLGLFNLAAKAAELPELNATFLSNNLFIFIAAVLVIFMNAGFAMVESGLCRQKNAVNILSKNLIVFEKPPLTGRIGFVWSHEF